MRNILLIPLAFTSVFAFANAKSDLAKVAAQLKICLDKPDNFSNTGMEDCTDKAGKHANAILNSVYKKIEKFLKTPEGDAYSDNLDKEMLKRLIASERSWITYRDAEVSLQGTQMLGGSGEPLLEIRTYYDLTKNRAIELENLFNLDNLNN